MSDREAYFQLVETVTAPFVVINSQGLTRDM